MNAPETPCDGPLGKNEVSVRLAEVAGDWAVASGSIREGGDATQSDVARLGSHLSLAPVRFVAINLQISNPDDFNSMPRF